MSLTCGIYSEVSDIKSIDIFKTTLLTQIGDHNTEENIIDFVPPPIIFIEIWRYNDDLVRRFEFDPFTVNVNDLDLQYDCIGTIIHTHDHFKTIAFDNNRVMLLDDELVADLKHLERQMSILNF